MKTVFSNDETAHVWAQQNQPHGNSGHGNVYFDGRCLFSYGSHYLTGYIMPDGRALINGRNYSISTAKHRGAAYRAASHRNPLTVPDLTNWRYELEALTRTNRSVRSAAALSRTDAARALRRKVEANALELPAEVGLYLMTAAGYSEAQWNRALNDAARRDARATAKALRASLELDRQQARTFGDMSDRQFAERVRQARAFGSEYAPASALKDLRDILYSAHRNGTASGTKADKVRRPVLWARLKRVREMISAIESGPNQIRARREVRQAIVRLRAALRPEYQPETATRSSRFGTIESACAIIRNQHPAGAPMDALDRLRRMAITAKESAELREEAERYAKQEADRAAWLRGESISSSVWKLADERGGALVRAKGVERDAAGDITGGTLETSQGASVPLCHAIRAFRFLKLCHDGGRQWESNGRTIRVGHYRIDRVEPSGDFVAGCHRINWGEVERLAVELGVFTLAPSEGALEPSHAAA